MYVSNIADLCNVEFYEIENSLFLNRLFRAIFTKKSYKIID